MSRNAWNLDIWGVRQLLKRSRKRQRPNSGLSKVCVWLEWQGIFSLDHPKVIQSPARKLTSFLSSLLYPRPPAAPVPFSASPSRASL